MVEGMRAAATTGCTSPVLYVQSSTGHSTAIVSRPRGGRTLTRGFSNVVARRLGTWLVS